MPMKTIGASMSGNSSVCSFARAAMPKTASAIVTTTVMIGRRIAKSEMNMVEYYGRDRLKRWRTRLGELAMLFGLHGLGRHTRCRDHGLLLEHCRDHTVLAGHECLVGV